jgi:hypothetical protein
MFSDTEITKVPLLAAQRTLLNISPDNNKCQEEEWNMAMEWDPIVFVNLVLCAVIVGLGYFGFRKTKNLLPIYVGSAFGLFGITHLLTLLGYRVLLTVPLIVIRIVAYLLVIYSLYRYWYENRLAAEARQAWVDFYKEATGKT